ncbi:MAG: peptidylprolyl isomerase [Ignavibacteria bacterium]|nr:peptidylprolyl isomerase [Ignavibacteria bacterium]MBK9225676.1 peptidylprolyl isomerase [Ignavibacteria bacterium]
MSSLFLFLVLVSLAACSSKKKQVVAEIGDEKIYLGEYENQYLKTQGNLDSAKNSSIESRKEFLDLYIKYRLKVKDARERGLLKSDDIQNDLNQYKSNFVTSFLVDKEVVEPQIKSLYDKKEYEVRASHILVNLPQQNKSVEDSIKAYQKANDILKKLKDGTPFEQVAFEMSEDNSAKQNYGDLYYFTAGMTVPEFEDAVYKLKVGDYTKEIVRTPFGLHIVKLTDKRKRSNGIRASHILIQEQKDSLGKTVDSMATYEKAKQVLQRIKNGEDFAAVATEVSQDPGSAQKGGDLGYFDRRRMVQPFDSVAFLLKVGEVSDLVRTPFGWHVIKVIDIKGYEPFDKQKETLKGDFKRGPQFKSDYTKFLDKARKGFNFEIKEEGIVFLKSKLDTTKTFSQFNLDSLFSPQDKETIIATYKDGKVSVTDFVSYLGRNRDFMASMATTENLNTVINNSADNSILMKVAVKENVEKDPDYIAQLTEYENGLLSFKVDQEELWRNIKITPEELSAYYESNKDKYSFTDSNMVKTRPFDDVKSEISNLLQQDRFKQLEMQYVENLKKKYPVKVNDAILADAFKN